MPAPTARHIATSTLCAALLLGTAAPALAATPDAGRADTRTARQDQAKVLAGLGTALTPVTRLVNSAVEADDDPLTEAEAKELADAAKEAVAEARKEVQEAYEEAEQERKEALQDLDDVLAEARKDVEEAREEAEAAKKESLDEATETAQEPVLLTNVTGDALGALGKALESLLSVLTSGSSEKVDTSAVSVVEALANVTVGTLVDRGLPPA
ncbi:hypothetical protein ACFQ6S_20090 [Streptomyces sp. NPDC056479]|uniref:hypothetical protein n=1 Tax=Streptomyces sp. NPDC056479 TaxID=3345832 RepID=UPI00367DD1BD